MAADLSHGPSVTDHNADRQRAPNETYWGARVRKLHEQTPDADIYAALTARLKPSADTSPSSGSHTSKRSKTGDDAAMRTTSIDATGVANADVGASVSVHLSAASAAVDSTTEPDKAADEASTIFKGVCVYFDGRLGGELSAHALGSLVRHHGGATSPFLSHKHGVTHLVCENLSGAKTEAALQSKRPTYKIVKPAWLYECVRAGRRLREDAYFVCSSSTQSRLSFAK